MRETDLLARSFHQLLSHFLLLHMHMQSSLAMYTLLQDTWAVRWTNVCVATGPVPETKTQDGTEAAAGLGLGPQQGRSPSSLTGREAGAAAAGQRLLWCPVLLCSAMVTADGPTVRSAAVADLPVPPPLMMATHLSTRYDIPCFAAKVLQLNFHISHL